MNLSVQKLVNSSNSRLRDTPKNIYPDRIHKFILSYRYHNNKTGLCFCIIRITKNVIIMSKDLRGKSNNMLKEA